MNHDEIRCSRCFCELHIDRYDCGIFVHFCDCDDIQDNILQRIDDAHESGRDDGYNDGKEKGTAIGFKNGQIHMKNRINRIIGDCLVSLKKVKI